MSKLIDTSDMDGGIVERPNKSQQKREIQALLELGKKLINLDESKLQRMGLPADLLSEIMAAKSMKHGALKRQIKLITKMLREIPTDSMVDTFEQLDARKAELDSDFHRIERWRDRLIAEGTDTLTEFMHSYPHADASQIRQLIRNAIRETAQGKPPKSSRVLFKLLRDTLQQAD